MSPSVNQGARTSGRSSGDMEKMRERRLLYFSPDIPIPSNKNMKKVSKGARDTYLYTEKIREESEVYGRQEVRHSAQNRFEHFCCLDSVPS